MQIIIADQAICKWRQEVEYQLCTVLVGRGETSKSPLFQLFRPCPCRRLRLDQRLCGQYSEIMLAGDSLCALKTPSIVVLFDLNDLGEIAQILCGTPSLLRDCTEWNWSHPYTSQTVSVHDCVSSFGDYGLTKAVGPLF
jgi:hypothetical protein